MTRDLSDRMFTLNCPQTDSSFNCDNVEFKSADELNKMSLIMNGSELV